MSTTVTLVTGDVVIWQDFGDGQPSYMTEAASRESSGTVGFHAEGDQNDLYIHPTDAMPYVASGVLDEELFNIPGLIQQGLDDASTGLHAVIVNYADTHEVPAARRAERSARELERSVDALPATEHPVGLRIRQGAGVWGSTVTTPMSLGCRGRAVRCA